MIVKGCWYTKILYDNFDKCTVHYEEEIHFKPTNLSFYISVYYDNGRYYIRILIRINPQELHWQEENQIKLLQVNYVTLFYL